MSGKIPEGPDDGELLSPMAHASQLIDSFGQDDAPHVAASFMYSQIQAGNLPEYRAWKAVLAAIVEMTRLPAATETVH